MLIYTLYVHHTMLIYTLYVHHTMLIYTLYVHYTMLIYTLYVHYTMLIYTLYHVNIYTICTLYHINIHAVYTLYHVNIQTVRWWYYWRDKTFMCELMFFVVITEVGYFMLKQWTSFRVYILLIHINPKLTANIWTTCSGCRAQTAQQHQVYQRVTEKNRTITSNH